MNESVQASIDVRSKRVGSLFLLFFGTGASGTGLGVLAFVSGFLALGLEVLWTRMFSQAHQNSAYPFSRKDLEIIERTVLSVFDQVSVWRADFDPYLPFSGMKTIGCRFPCP